MEEEDLLPCSQEVATRHRAGWIKSCPSNPTSNHHTNLTHGTMLRAKRSAVFGHPCNSYINCCWKNTERPADWS
jgi:hypothetical protein